MLEFGIARRAALLIALFITFAGGIASAQPSAEDLQAAEAHYKQGEAFFAAGSYDRAIEQFEDAYRRAPRPLLQFNIGLCYQRKGNRAAAIERFKRYIADEPRGDRVNEAAEYVATLTRELDAANSAEALRLKQQDERKQAEQRRLAEQRTRQEEARETRKARARTMKIIGATIGGVGLVVVGVGIKYGIDAYSYERELMEYEGPFWTDGELAKFSQGQTAETRSVVAASIGGALVVTGAIVLILGLDDEPPERTIVAPTVTGSGAGAAIRGVF
ncbi:MAG: tetratricopeptide repeat protein [Kofleriaceae bacterium]